MSIMNDKCAAWKAAEDIDYSLYGTPIESTTYKFAKCLQKRFTLYKRYNAYQKKMCTAMFDSRVFSVPKEEVCNCLIWRQQDATRNSIEAVGQANFSHHELHKKTCNMIQEMLWSQRGINWNDFLAELKRGSCCIKRQFEETIDDPRNPDQKITVCRNRWIIDHEIPIFTQDREYIERLI